MCMTVKAPAKINLSLDVGPRRADGYHPIRSVMQAVTLFDTVRLERIADGIELSASDPALPCGEENTAHRAARAFAAATGYVGGVRIRLEKNIPMQAGLAGGSADAAAVLAGLNRLAGDPLPLPELCRLAAGIGADVPFCLVGGTQLAEGIGERMTPAPPMPDGWIVLAKPPVGVSTGAAYAAVDALPPAEREGTPALLQALASGELPRVAAALDNRFMAAVALPEVAALCRAMRMCGALGAAMSGSGSAVFGLFDGADAANACAQQLQGQAQTFVCRPCRGGAAENFS